jgi:hypothetical protein
MRNFLWCSPHTPTEEQLQSLQSKGNLLFLKDISPMTMSDLTNTPSSRIDCRELADTISDIAEANNAKIIQLGGSPMFLVVASSVIGSGRMIFADSERVSEDIPQPDGSVKKVSIFKHKGWI